MPARKKLFPILLLVAFTTTFLFGFHYPLFEKETQDDGKITLTPLHKFGVKKEMTGTRRSHSQQDESGSIVSFQKRLQGKVNKETLDELFDEAFDPHHYSEYLTEKKRGLIIQKWGELAPMQGLKKLQEQEGGIDYLPSLFAGWASKDPRGALAFYTENYKETSIHSASVLNAVIGEYALQSPAEAWESLTVHEDALPPHLVSKIKQRCLMAAAHTHPEMIPEMIEKLGPSSKWATEDNMGNVAYNLGTYWGAHDHTSREWLENLPEELKAHAEAGRIMGITKGNVEQVGEYLQQCPEGEREAIAKELTYSFFYAGLDKVERINLLAQYGCLDRMKGNFKYWTRWDREASKQWIHSLPEGEQKDMLLEWDKEADERVQRMNER